MAVESTATDIYTGTRQGRGIAKAFADQRRRQMPGVLIYNGIPFDCTASADEVGRRGAELLLEGAANAAFADTRTVTTGPHVFQEGAACTYAGKPYTISSVPAPQIMAGTAVAQRLILTRAALPVSATAETPEEAAQSGHPEDAGKRVNYRPKSATG